MGAQKRIEDSYAEFFPEDFGKRLERLTQLAGLSWEEFAQRLGVEDERVTEWRKGTIPHRRRGMAHHAAGVVGSRRHGSDASRERRARRGRGVAMLAARSSKREVDRGV